MFTFPNAGCFGMMQYYPNSNSQIQTNLFMNKSPNIFFYPNVPYPMTNISFTPPVLCNEKPLKNTNDFVIDENLNIKMQRRKFTPEEDQQLKNLVAKMGCKKWGNIAKYMPGRSGRQCRDRYQKLSYPGYFSGQWSKEEDEILLSKYKEMGSQWSKMTAFFKNRNANALKNRFNYFISKHVKDPKAMNNSKSNNEENSKNSDQHSEKSMIDFSFSLNFPDADQMHEKDDSNDKNELLANPFLFNENLIE